MAGPPVVIEPVKETPTPSPDVAVTARDLVSQAVKNVPAPGAVPDVPPTATEPAPIAPVVPVASVAPVEPAVEPVVVEPVAAPIVESVVPPVAAADPVPAVVPEVVSQEGAAAIAVEAGVPYQDVVDQLQALGIGVEHEGIPEELHERYGALLKATAAAVQPVFEEQENAKRSLDSVENFKKRLAERPEATLLSLWKAAPEVFAKVADIAQQAKDDPEYKERVLREIEVAAREATVDARELQLSEQVLGEKGRRAAAITRETAQRLGVDPTVAEKYIIAAVSSIGGDEFDLTSIEGIVKDLRPAVPRTPVPKVITPTQVAATVDAPAVPIASDSPPTPAPAPVPGASSGLNPNPLQKGRGGKFAGLIRAAGLRVDALRGT